MSHRRAGLALALAMSLAGSSCALVGVAPQCGGMSLIAEFEQVGDLVKNANVQASDVEVGRIQDISLDGFTARVTMCIDEGQRIPADVQATVRTTSLLGEKFVELSPRTEGPPYLESGDVIGVEDTGKASELEDVFAQLATILGSGNLEQLNRFTSSQARILEDHTGDVREVLARLRRFTGLLADKKDQVGAAVDSLDSVAQTILADQGTLETFLETFAGSSKVLNEQKQELQDLLFALDRFTKISVQLLGQTEGGLNKQFARLRPGLRTLAANSADLDEALRTLATFLQWFPESMPGDYLQLDVCQAMPESFGQGTTCPQNDRTDDPDRASRSGAPAPPATGRGIELILRQPLRGAD
ncbi:MAG: MCE family protein [Actinomycetota bacterium]